MFVINVVLFVAVFVVVVLFVTVSVLIVMTIRLDRGRDDGG